MELPITVLFVRVTLPIEVKIPPPLPPSLKLLEPLPLPVELPITVLFVRVTFPLERINTAAVAAVAKVDCALPREVATHGAICEGDIPSRGDKYRRLRSAASETSETRGVATQGAIC